MLKFKSETRTRRVQRTIEGITNDVEAPYTVRTPILPRDWDRTALKTVAGMVMALTIVAVSWSTVSIGAILHGGVGYAAAAMFDVSWGAVLIFEWLSRFDPDKRRFAQRLGIVLVVITAGSLFWHGLLLHSWALAAIGALISVVAKLLWLGVFRHVERNLAPADRQWVAAELSKANAKLAIAGVRRQAATAEAHARLELLAAEQVLGELDELMPNRPEQDAEPAAALSVVRGSAQPLNSPNSVRTEVEQGPSIAELARRHVANGASNQDAEKAILAARPEANASSVAATVRRARKQTTNGYL
jgi:hypothetical protein